MHQVKFNNKVKPFKNLLDQRIKEFFTSQELNERGNWKLYSKTIILFTVLLGSLATVLFVLPNSWWAVAVFMLMGLTMASIGFNVMHDAAHGSYSKNVKLNNFIAFLGGDAMGGGTFFWKIKHNIIHHTYTNVEGIDDDIAKYPMYRFSPHQKRLWFHKFQHIYGIPAYMLISLNWLLTDDVITLFKKKINTTPIRNIATKEIVLMFAGKILNILLFLVLPLLLMQWQIALVGFLCLHACMGLSLAIVFQLAHVVEHTEFPLADVETNVIDNEWAKHQVETTANFAMRNKAISWYVGGLNYQVEHHLYPRISHIHYPKISKIVKDTCEEMGVRYTAFPTMLQAFGSHVRLLKQLGAA